MKIVENSKIWLSISGSLLALSLIFICISFFKFGAPVRLGLDFVGGTKIEYLFVSPQKKLVSVGVSKVITPIKPDHIVQIAGQTLILRSKELSDEQRKKIDTSLKNEFGQFEVLAVDTISPTIGPELLRSGLIALLVALLGILIYVSSRFRKDYAFCAIVALCHDVLIIVGFFSALGLFFGLEVNTLFLTACLTVLGFSVHDTIVVFDRVRENMQFLSKKNGFDHIVNNSVGQIWFRSLCTSLTILITLASLMIFGGASTQVFSGAMFVGILIGTYSSIFVASTLLAFLNKKSRA